MRSTFLVFLDLAVVVVAAVAVARVSAVVPFVCCYWECSS